MALYYSIVFAILCTEIMLFLGLLVPLPKSLRKRALLWINNNIIKQVDYTLKVVFVFIFILFIDSVNRMMKATEAADSVVGGDVRVDNAAHAKKFYSQRNMYLTGFTLLLSLILNYTFSLLLALLTAEEKLEVLTKTQPSTSNDIANVEKHQKEIEELNVKLEEAKKKVADFDILKKQADQQHKEYMNLADRFNELSKAQETEDKKSA
ncbi:B-cell receptor-associated 31-like protein [Conidiobolus coronatus NRRL 28638]|uniref:Endoplasmic reticulum transmembrane protein n=1 Tax=Conidiobolus coronatus (strain ATCC 28846 / CBS 209.66 / NRRL 28638) TaxID=796925 RepID=A0A137NZJ0_CONC2|nr:B-cell receptor-associated 31-like protein [Conidiobolus coronatus NRRL 28638]|eukprot:KXN68246.1 B-cell receptor-associated 31-like protein [Conidiobolus coronatus NRRL 28638]